MRTKPTCFDNPEELQKKVDAYFKHCEDSKKVYELKNGDIKIRQEFPSMAGLTVWLDCSRETLYSYIEMDEKVSQDAEITKQISDTLSRAREKIKRSLVQSSMSGDADSRIAGMLLTAMGETTPESSTTVNVIIQGDSDAYSVQAYAGYTPVYIALYYGYAGIYN